MGKLTNEEPNTLNYEQNKRLNIYADKLMKVLADAIESKDESLVKVIVISMILLAKEPDETYLLVEEACDWMLAVEFKGSIAEAVELFLKNKNGE